MIAQMTTKIIIRPIIDGFIERSFLERLSKNTAIDNYIDNCVCIYQKKTVREKCPSFSHGLHLTIFFVMPSTRMVLSTCGIAFVVRLLVEWVFRCSPFVFL